MEVDRNLVLKLEGLHVLIVMLFCVGVATVAQLLLQQVCTPATHSILKLQDDKSLSAHECFQNWRFVPVLKHFSCVCLNVSSESSHCALIFIPSRFFDSHFETFFKTSWKCRVKWFHVANANKCFPQWSPHVVVTHEFLNVTFLSWIIFKYHTRMKKLSWWKTRSFCINFIFRCVGCCSSSTSHFVFSSSIIHLFCAYLSLPRSLFICLPPPRVHMAVKMLSKNIFREELIFSVTLGSPVFHHMV